MPGFRAILFRLHWALGLTAGLVLAVVGATGALLSYEEALTALANRDRATVPARAAEPLGPEALLARLAAAAPGLRVDALTFAAAPEGSPRARFARDPATGARPPALYLDPYDGAPLGPVRGEAGFSAVRDLHRWLLVPGGGDGWGRTVTGACALALLAFLATGLYLRWPRIHTWRIWLRPALARPGRARWWSLHAVLGTWLAPVYLVIVLSGLTWSYEAYKAGATWLLTGQTTRMRPDGPRTERGAGAPRPAPALDRAWAAFRAGEGREAALATLTVPETGPIRIRWQARDGVGRNDATFDAATGAPHAVDRHADKPLGRQIADNMLEVHRGRFFGDAAALLFCLAALLMPGFAATGLTLYVLRRRARRGRAAPRSRNPEGTGPFGGAAGRSPAGGPSLSKPGLQA
ncbi:PepSY-associated TM helix domain-containing protein [Methylobacterium sp. NEAU 140]|uniref:PepSY-associated TM helix domain-containing protein n=1 Tax=Methylobacterium sp. NEAU 140 TaxID=3064945 RepID=UPI002732BD0D|nr:PepSY-associated TM helix domain-containing protein [Methylobacterium sp. NEAU 140]MDP4023701.1 PepSY-associated TM helix domain-containing protein [Methylobacterium sp. NEAU 140]